MAYFERYSHIALLLAKALQEDLTEEEVRELEAWRLEDKANEALYQSMMSPEFVNGKVAVHERFQAEPAYQRVRAVCRKRARRRRIYRLGGVAAAVLLALGVGYYVWMREPQLDKIPLVHEVIVPGEAKAELILAGGERLFLGTEVQDSVLKQPGAEVHASGEHLNYVKGEETQEIQYNILRVPRGGEYTVTLQDGSVVQLNSASELRYPVQFAGQERRVFLSGEAYFEVAKDAWHPFVVEVGHAEIEVLGTSFNVYSYLEEQKTEATLVEGKVRFSAGGQEVTLSPGEQGVWDTAGHLDKREVDVYPYIAWKDGKFVFRKRTLEEVMRIVSRWYNVNVVFEDAVSKQVSFSGNIRRYDDFSQVVGMLEMTGGLEFKIEGKTIYIAAK